MSKFTGLNRIVIQQSGTEKIRPYECYTITLYYNKSGSLSNEVRYNLPRSFICLPDALEFILGELYNEGVIAGAPDIYFSPALDTETTSRAPSQKYNWVTQAFEALALA